VYERTFGTDWDELDHEEALHRAFAIGVAESLGQDPPDGELDRLRGQADGRYARSLLELAYDEGQAKGGRPHPDHEVETVWSSLVEGDGEPVEPFHRSSTVSDPARRTDLPASISTPDLLGRERDDLSKLRLPEFLR